MRSEPDADEHGPGVVEVGNADERGRVAEERVPTRGGGAGAWDVSA